MLKVKKFAVLGNFVKNSMKTNTIMSKTQFSKQFVILTCYC